MISYLEIMDNYSFRIIEFLEKKFGKELKTDIAIFGAGEWGTKTCLALVKKNVVPKFFVDNNEENWGREKCGIRILKPDILKSFKGVLLIVVKDFSADILSQIKEMNNLEISCITWEDIADELILE